MKKTLSERTKGIVALILLAFVFASMGLFVRFLKADFTILQQTYLRIFAAFVIGFIVFYKDLDFSKLKKISKKEWGILLFRAVSLYLLAVTIISSAITLAKYSNVSFIGALPLTAVLGFILLKEKVTWSKILYILVGFVGVVIIAVKDYAHLFTWGQGELLALIGSVCFALSYIARKWQGDLLNNKEIAVLIFFISTILLFVTSTVFFHEGMPHPSSWSFSILAVIFMAGLFNVANLFLTNYGFQKVDAVLASNLLSLETVFAVFLGFIFFFELPTVKELIGGVLIVFSAYQMNRIDS